MLAIRREFEIFRRARPAKHFDVAMDAAGRERRRGGLRAFLLCRGDTRKRERRQKTQTHLK